MKTSVTEVTVYYTVEDSSLVYRFVEDFNPELFHFANMFLNRTNNGKCTVRMNEVEFYNVTKLLRTLGYTFNTSRIAKDGFKKGE